MNDSSDTTAIVKLARTLQENAGCRGHRAVLVLSGEREWCRKTAETLLDSLQFPHRVWLGESKQGEHARELRSARTLLGQELNGVVFDAWSGFDAEAFGAISGTLQAGGMLLLLTPPLAQWHDYNDPQHERLAVTPYKPEEVSGRFVRHVAEVLQGMNSVVKLCQGKPLPRIDREGGTKWSPSFLSEGITEEQGAAVVAIQRVVHGHRRRPLVLTSDRGRGKSSALGIAAARLLRQGTEYILVTAPRLAAAKQLFEHAEKLLAGAQRQRGLLQWQGRRIEFIPPDALTLTPRKADLLLVDEAAAIPTPLLERLLNHYARIVFASTVHGYEGTGRGFVLRFQKVLTQRTPGWHAMQLNQPVRWAEADPLERLSFRALMLDAEPAAMRILGDVGHREFEWIERDRLIENGADLTELFGLLVLAHYRTSPNDLRYLLDGPNVRIAVLRHEGHIIATALVAEEGRLSEALAQGIYQGRRRAHGHLLPQSLAVHAGFAEAPLQYAWRVVRIAVHPALMRRGLGRELLQHLLVEAQNTGVDYLGASFGGDEPLLGFWLDAGWKPVRVGLSREAASGTHSLMVMRAISEDGRRLFQGLQSHLAEQLPVLLAESLTDLDAGVTAALFRALPLPKRDSLSTRDWQDIVSFAEFSRGYDVCYLALWRLAIVALGDKLLQGLLDEAPRQLLVQKVLQRHDWKTLAEVHSLNGRAQVVQVLRECYRAILSDYRLAGGHPIIAPLATHLEAFDKAPDR